MYPVIRYHLLIPQGSYFDGSLFAIELYEAIRLSAAVSASATATALPVDRLGISIDTGVTITFDTATVTTTATVSPGGTSIPIDSLSTALAAGSVGKVRPIDLSDYTIESTIRRRFGSTDVWTLPWIIESAIDGRIVPDLSDTTLATIPANSKFSDFEEDFVVNLQDEGSWSQRLKNVAYVWDLEAISSNGRRRRYVEGWVLVTSEVTT